MLWRAVGGVEAVLDNLAVRRAFQLWAHIPAQVVITWDGERVTYPQFVDWIQCTNMAQLAYKHGPTIGGAPAAADSRQLFKAHWQAINFATPEVGVTYVGELGMAKNTLPGSPNYKYTPIPRLRRAVYSEDAGVVRVLIIHGGSGDILTYESTRGMLHVPRGQLADDEDRAHAVYAALKNTYALGAWFYKQPAFHQVLAAFCVILK